MQQYQELLHDVLVNGVDKSNRTGIDTRAVFGRMVRFNLQDGFPVLTTKQMGLKTILAELLWFIEGSGDERRLAELTYGSRDDNKSTIWTANAEAAYWKPKANFKGDLGRVYGVQWRHWRKTSFQGSADYLSHPEGGETHYNAKVLVQEVDQLKNIVNTLKTNPDDRRMLLTAWNPGELDQMALPPCHLLANFNVTNGRLNCLMTQRSCDLFLGVPFNIASYALLVHMLAQVTNLEVGELILSLGDLHIYHNHLDQAREQLQRKPYPLPKLELNKDITDIDGFKLSDFKLVGYQSHPAIKGDMAV